MPPRRSTFAVILAAAAATALIGNPATADTAPFNQTATGTVFFPNPVQQLGMQTLTDNKDADSPAFAPAYRRVTLTDLDGSGTLTGRYVVVKSKTGKPAARGRRRLPGPGTATPTSSSRSWATTGSPPRSRTCSTSASAAALRPVNQRQIELRIDQYGGDNSFFREDKANITLGKGGVDDAEDAEVIVHEYGHSVQDGQVPGFGTTWSPARSARRSATTWPSW